METLPPPCGANFDIYGIEARTICHQIGFDYLFIYLFIDQFQYHTLCLHTCLIIVADLRC